MPRKSKISYAEINDSTLVNAEHFDVVNDAKRQLLTHTPN